MPTKFSTTLEKIIPLTSDVRLFHFKINNSQKLSFLAGQYMMLNVPGENGQSVKRLYSLASPESMNDGFELLIKIILGGVAGDYLSKIKVGDLAEFDGPAGLFVMRESARDKIIMVTGTGLAPALSMIKSNVAKLLAENKKMILFWGLPNMNEGYLLDNLKEIAQKYSNFSFHICLSREKNFTPIKSANCFHHDRVTGGWVEMVGAQDVNKFDYYLCSGRDILDSLKQHLFDRGVLQENVFFEKF